MTTDEKWKREVESRPAFWRQYVLSRCVSAPTRGCWLWPTAHRVDRPVHRYGIIRRREFGGVVRVHRLMMALWNGFDLTSRLCILHRCDTPACINPDHLFIGTRADNMLDKCAKGRQSSRPPSARTHCGNGHDLSVVGEYLVKSRFSRPTRVCKACSSAQKRRTYLRQTGRL